MTTSKQLTTEFARLLQEAERLSGDWVEEVETILHEGIDRPLTEDEARSLLSKVVAAVHRAAERAGDMETAEGLAGQEFLNEVLGTRRRLAGSESNGRRADGRQRVKLQARRGIEPGPVFPRPSFHMREVPMNEGFVKVRDIKLWDANERLDIHVAQFERENGRRPSGDEVLEIMLSRMPLPGVEDDDQFKIKELARSIANNGVRRPPVIDLDGTLRDGNRRLAACHYILESDEFSSEQKSRVEWVFVWQFTEHATDEDRELVMVSLNFEPDYKKDWPEYVKARKVYEEWQRLLNLEPRTPTYPRELELKRTVSQSFALGPRLDTVNRYIRMVEWANDFEEHEVGTRKRDEFEVKHRAAEKFQYFDELSKGPKPGGVAHTLGQEDALKELAFDLLFQDKFKNFAQIRLLRHVPDNTDVLAILRDARNDQDRETGREKVDDALDILKSSRAEKRRLGANSRIESFVEWLEDVPLKAPRDHIKPENLEALLRALKLARGIAVEVLGKERVDAILRDDS